MRAKIIIGLLIALAALSMFAISTRTSASSNSRPLLSYTPEPNISIDMYELRGNGSLKDEKCAPGSTKFGCTAFCDNSEDEYKQWCTEGEPIEPYPYESSTIVVPIQTYYLLDVLAGEMSPSPDWMPIPTALRAQAIAARSYAWWQYENVELPINNSNSFPEHRHLSMDLHHGRQSPHPFPRLRVALSLAKRFVNHIHRWWRVRL